MPDTDDGKLEIGIEAIKTYNLGAPITKDIKSAENIYNDLVSGWGNNVKIKHYNKAVKEVNFKGKSLGGNDSNNADSVDLLFFVGHGVKPNSYGSDDNSLIMNTKSDKYYAELGEMRLGNTDLEWFITITCNFLNTSLSKIGRAAYGVHAICGFQTQCLVTANAGKILTDKLQAGYSVKESFFSYAAKTQAAASDVHRAAVFTNTYCANESIWEYGSTMGGDPKPYNTDSSKYILYYYDIY